MIVPGGGSMKEYAYYYETGPVPYVIFTTTKSLDVGGQTMYVSGEQEAVFQSNLRRAERVNF